MARRRARRRKSSQSYGELQAALSAKERPIENLESDLYAEIEADFNLLIKTTVADLTSDAAKGGYIPVLTGFFASNWKAGTNAISKTENIKGTEWERIKNKTKIIKIGSKTKTVLAAGQSPYLPRCSVPRDWYWINIAGLKPEFSEKTRGNDRDMLNLVRTHTF